MTKIMGIVNATPDSFSDGGRYFAADTAIAHGRRLLADGADIIDVGGESTRPGAERVPDEEERRRSLPVVRALAEAGAVVSIDTMNASTAAAAVEAGARIVNDVSGGLADPGLLAAVAGSGADVVLGHWRGSSDDMYARAAYADVVTEVTDELRGRVDAALAAGVDPARIVLDPGVGFAKRGAANWAVLHGLPTLVALGYRVLIGTSRKRFLDEALDPEDVRVDASDTASRAVRRDAATAVTSVLAADGGAWAVRVHDVVLTRDALAVAALWRGADGGVA